MTGKIGVLLPPQNVKGVLFPQEVVCCFFFNIGLFPHHIPDNFHIRGGKKTQLKLYHNIATTTVIAVAEPMPGALQSSFESLFERPLCLRFFLF